MIVAALDDAALTTYADAVLAQVDGQRIKASG